MAKARVYIIDEHDTVRLALADRLGKAGDLKIIGHAGGADQAVSEVRRERPDVVLVEVKRSDGLGLEILRQVSEMPNAPRVMVLTSYPSTWEEEAACRAGAVSYLLKDIDSEELIRHIGELAGQ